MGFFMWSMLGLVMGSMFGSVMESFLDITLIKCIKGHKSEKSHTLCLNYKVSASQSASTQDTSMDPPEREKKFSLGYYCRRAIFLPPNCPNCPKCQACGTQFVNITVSQYHMYHS